MPLSPGAAAVGSRPVQVVVTCIPQTGHITPLLALAEAFQAQGDEVVLASGPDAEPTAAARHIPFRPVAPGYGEWFERLRARTRGLPGDGLAPGRVEGYFLPRLFGEVGAAVMIDGLLGACRELRPDLLVFDPVAFAAPLAGAVLGIPVAQHTVGPRHEGAVLDLVADAVSPLWREFGLDVPAAAGVYEGHTIAICPPSLDPGPTDPARQQLLRPTALPAPTPPALPVTLPRPGDPVVYLTLGTFSNSLEEFRSLLEALAGEPVNLVVTVGTDNDPALLAPLPANAVVERFIPQAELLPHCDAAVHHAGAGTTFGILAHGLPSVAVPQSADNFRIGERLAAAGAARTLMPDEAAGTRVADALRQVLADDRYRRAAGALADEIASMPDAADVARALRAAVPAG